MRIWLPWWLWLPYIFVAACFWITVAAAYGTIWIVATTIQRCRIRT